MEKEFVPYEIALKLKELGFNQPCFGYYTGDKKHLQLRPNMGRINEPSDDVPTAPTFSQVFRWFREKYNLEGILFKNLKDNTFWKDNFKTAFYSIRGKYNNIIYNTISKEKKSYEEAEIECLKKLIEIVKK